MGGYQSQIERKAAVKLNRFYSSVIEYHSLRARDREAYLSMLVEGGIDAWSLPVKHDQAVMLMYIYVSVEPDGGRRESAFHIYRPVR